MHLDNAWPWAMSLDLRKCTNGKIAKRAKCRALSIHIMLTMVPLVPLGPLVQPYSGRLRLTNDVLTATH
jgi:hypothetical protein